MELGLKGKHALVTGGSHGIGLATALVLASEGCHVAIAARDAKKLAAAKKKLSAKGVKVIAVSADLTFPEQREYVMQSILARWKKIDILVNNVGGGGRWGTDFVETTPEGVWREVYEKNAMAAAYFTSACIPLMKKAKWGRVVTVASVHGMEGGGRPWFNMAKSAQISLMKSCALKLDLARSGITFNAVAPGCLMIPGTGWDRERKKNPARFEKMVQNRFPLGRMGTAKEVAALIAFICSRQTSYLNGACIAIDGAESKSF